MSLSTLWSRITIFDPTCFFLLDIKQYFVLFIFQALALLCMMCAAPAYHSTQHWFLLVVTLAFLGTIFFSLYHLCLDTYLKTVNVGWLPTVSTLFPIQRSK